MPIIYISPPPTGTWLNILCCLHDVGADGTSSFLNFTRNTGHEHPHLKAAIQNYVCILEALGLSESEIEMKLSEMQKESGNNGQSTLFCLNALWEKAGRWWRHD
jgi:hypothetical protein